MLRRLYAWTMGLAAHRHADRALFGVAFAESSVFPIPPDAILVPMILAEPSKAYRFAALCTLGSVLGAMFGYAIGAILYDSVGAWVVSLYGYAHQMQAFQDAYAKWGAWIILLKGLTPIPFKIVTITSGFAHYNFAAFVGLCLVTRGARFFIEAALLRRYGEPVRAFIEHRLEWVTLAFAAIMVAGVIAARFLL